MSTSTNDSRFNCQTAHNVSPVGESRPEVPGSSRNAPLPLELNLELHAARRTTLADGSEQQELIFMGTGWLGREWVQAQVILTRAGMGAEERQSVNRG